MSQYYSETETRHITKKRTPETNIQYEQRWKNSQQNVNVNWKKNYNLKVENYAFFSRQTEDISPGGSLSQISLKVTISKN